MSAKAILKQPSAVLPLAMSALAITAIAVHLVRFGAAPQADEGAAAHLWQILMAAQIPIIAFFSIKWLPREPQQALRVLLLQIAGIIAALAPVYFLRW